MPFSTPPNSPIFLQLSVLLNNWATSLRKRRVVCNHSNLVSRRLLNSRSNTTDSHSLTADPPIDTALFGQSQVFPWASPPKCVLFRSSSRFSRPAITASYSITKDSSTDPTVGSRSDSSGAQKEKLTRGLLGAGRAGGERARGGTRGGEGSWGEQGGRERGDNLLWD